MLQGTAAYDRAEVRAGGDFADYLGLLRDSLGGVEVMEVFEGLPHPIWETELYEREVKSRRSWRMFDGAFYAKPKRPTLEQAISARVIFPEAVSEYAGEKECGEFHADYAIRWRDPRRKIWTALFCYGCGEVAIFGPAGTLKADLNGPDAKAWREWLAQFDGQRPRPTTKAQ